MADAIAWHADVFVSLHQNWSTSTAAAGVETFCATPQSQALAKDLEQAVVAGTGLQRDGLAHRVFWVVACNPMPAVLMEGGFLGNPAEAAEISSSGSQAREAQAIAHGPVAHFANPGNPVGAQALPQRLRTMCATNPEQVRGLGERAVPAAPRRVGEARRAAESTPHGDGGATPARRGGPGPCLPRR